MLGEATLTLARGVAMAPERAETADWRALFDAHWPWVHRLLRRLCGPGVDAEDAAQDVFVAVVRKLPGFEGRAALRTWIYRICLNVASEHRRRAWRRRRLAAALQLVAGWGRRSGGAPDLTTSGELALVQQALDRLGVAKRQVFVLREIEQLSGAEVAAILGIPEATVRTRLFHARREFAAHLARAGVTP